MAVEIQINDSSGEEFCVVEFSDQEYAKILGLALLDLDASGEDTSKLSADELESLALTRWITDALERMVEKVLGEKEVEESSPEVTNE